MPKYIAFLRAVNVGGRVVTMDRLRGLFEAAGFANVETFIASGNVIFDSTSRSPKALEAKVEAALAAALGYAVTTFVRKPSEVGAVARFKPFDDADLTADGNALYVGFLAGDPGDDGRARLAALTTPADEFRAEGREVYWLCRKKISESDVSGAQIERALGTPATFRNATTVRKLAAKYP